MIRLTDENVNLIAAKPGPNVQDEPRPWLARAVLLGARIVTAMVVGSGALLGVWSSDMLIVLLTIQH
jgi:hypothetical protein